MTEPVKLKITKQGVQSALSVQNTGLKLSIASVKYSTTNFVSFVNDDRTDIGNVVYESAVAAGGISTELNTLRLMTLVDVPADVNAASIGVYTDTGILFAVASVETGTLLKIPASLNYALSFGMTLSPILLENINIIIDQNAAMAMALVMAHENHPDPHPQYASKLLIESIRESLLEEINAMMAVTEIFFPPLLQTQYSAQGVYSMRRDEAATYAMSSSKIALMCTPEGLHEGWSIERTADAVNFNTFERSNYDRIEYIGRVNYLVIDTARVLANKGYRSIDQQLDNEIRTGVIEQNMPLQILRESSKEPQYNSTDTVVLICPEGEHEGWSLGRTENQINITLNNRSLAAKTAYSGRVNYMLLKKKSAPTGLTQYPHSYMAGISNTSNFTISPPPGVNFENAAYMPLITPEGDHEAWTVSRTSDGKFTVNVLTRNGASRANAAAMKVNWAIFLMHYPYPRHIYDVGQNTFYVQPGRKVRIDMFGAGGGGGSGRWSTAYHDANGTDGEDSKFYISSQLIATAGGGKGGIGGVWGNGSSYSNGKPGPGGQNTINAMPEGCILKMNMKGNNAVLAGRWQWQKGARGTSIDMNFPERNNSGGHGGAGVVDGWSYGGPAGSGGYVSIEYENTTSQPVTLNWNMGAHGKYAPVGNVGTDGGDGFLILTELN